VITIDPQSWRGEYELGKALVSRKSYNEAITHLQKALRLNPELGEAHYQLSLALGRTGQASESARELEISRRLIAQDERTKIAGTTLTRAEEALQKGDVPQAVNDFREATRLKPDWANAHQGLGLALLRQGKVDDAISEFTKALELKPDYYEANLGLGRALYEKSEYAAAAARLQDAIRLRPSSVEAYNSLGGLSRGASPQPQRADCAGQPRSGSEGQQRPEAQLTGIAGYGQGSAQFAAAP
jgi:tetratricopeptide (TPR) repeat protein